jgi:hypothetical protein
MVDFPAPLWQLICGGRGAQQSNPTRVAFERVSDQHMSNP